MSQGQTIQLAVKEIERYAGMLIEMIDSLSESQLWSQKGNIPNSIGTLARHLTGNLNHYFGAGMLQNGYQRDRDREFNEIDLPKAKVTSDLLAAVKITKEALEMIDEESSRQAYTTPCGEKYASLAYHIVRLSTHFALHCGQADYAKSYVR